MQPANNSWATIISASYGSVKGLRCTLDYDHANTIIRWKEGGEDYGEWVTVSSTSLAEGTDVNDLGRIRTIESDNGEEIRVLFDDSERPSSNQTDSDITITGVDFRSPYYEGLLGNGIRPAPPSGGGAVATVEPTATNAFQEFTVSSNPADQSVTVPDDADICIVSILGYDSDFSGALITELCFDDGDTIDFSPVETADWSSDPSHRQIDVYSMVNTATDWPGSGAKTLSITLVDDPIGEGVHVGVQFWRNVDVSDPIIDTHSSDTDYNGRGAYAQESDYVGNLSGLTASDMAVIIGYEYQSTPRANDTGQTELTSGIYNTAGYAIGYELGEANPVATFTGAEGMCGVALALRASGMVNSAPVVNNQAFNVPDGSTNSYSIGTVLAR